MDSKYQTSLMHVAKCQKILLKLLTVKGSCFAFCPIAAGCHKAELSFFFDENAFLVFVVSMYPF